MSSLANSSPSERKYSRLVMNLIAWSLSK